MGSDERVVAVLESNGKCNRLKIRVKNRQAHSAAQQVVKLTFDSVGYEPNMHLREIHTREAAEGTARGNREVDSHRTSWGFGVLQLLMAFYWVGRSPNLFSSFPA